MAALLQSYPQQSTSISILQSRPTSSSGILPTSQNQVNHQPSNKSHSQITSLHGMNNLLPLANYRGPSLITSIAPYAFSSTPDLNLSSQNIQSNSLPLSDKNTTVISSNNITARKTEFENQKGSTSRNASPIISNGKNLTGNSSQIFEEPVVKKTDYIASASQISNPGSCLAQNSALQTSKASPGRYRRTPSQTIDSSNTPGAGQTQNNSDIMPCSFSDFSLQMPSISDLVTESNNDAKQGRTGTSEPQRYRHRSLHSNNGIALATVTSPTPIQAMNLPTRPYSSHRREDSIEGSASIRSSSSKVNKNNRKESVSSLKSFSFHSQAPNSTPESNQINKESSDSIKIPPRSSSSDAVKRHVNPSPLSNPVIIDSEPSTKDSFASAVSTALQRPTVPASSSISKGNLDSQAAAQLNSISKKDGKKSKKFRLRRAISFGSAAELQKITNSKKYSTGPEDTPNVQNGNPDDELDAEQTRIAEQQEAGGIGSGIYTGQGNFFTGSTDNLSISSTASSASIMIRKMGKGMKKSTRSLVGIFRSKNFNGVSSESLGTNASEPQLSVIEVEAERESIFQSQGPPNTGSLRLEKSILGKPILEIETSFSNSDRLGSSSTENSAARKSIVGGDKERAEALAAVKKGILKRSGVGPDSSTSAVSSQSFSNIALQLPQQVIGAESPILPLPRTPNDDHHGLRRAGSGTFGTEDYFSSMLRFGGSPKSQTETLLSSIVKRNTTFSPRIQFHDTWPSREYDRRGEVATCNRLTPILAQQIKEELNTFKMEMEVHETSKIYTHFF